VYVFVSVVSYSMDVVFSHCMDMFLPSKQMLLLNYARPTSWMILFSAASFDFSFCGDKEGS